MVGDGPLRRLQGIRKRICGAAGGAALIGSIAALAQPAIAREVEPLLADSFALGGSAEALCQVQNRSEDALLANPFDRAWAIVCRDTALPVGRIYALRGDDADARLAGARRDFTCPVGTPENSSDMIEGALQKQCVGARTGLPYTVVSLNSGKSRWVAEGFSAYDSALDLALRSLLANAIQPGEVTVATASVADSEAFARIQAQTLDPRAALAEGYRRNNAGDYADAAAFFEQLGMRDTEDRGATQAEYLANTALQRSNLGQFTEADILFAQAAALPARDPITERKLRNFRAIHELNRGNYADAIEQLAVPLRVSIAPGGEALRRDLTVTAPLAERINANDPILDALGLVDDQRLSAEEHAAILDAQADHLRGSSLYYLGRTDEAERALDQAQSRVLGVRGGRVVSIIRMRGQILSQLARMAEDRGDLSRAEGLLKSAVSMVSVQYPETRSLAAAQAQLASFYARHGRSDEAAVLYREIVANSLERTDGLTGLSGQMAPWFDILAARMDSNPQASADFLAAAQILMRPGVADTQAVLSRELSAGNDEAARLFRQSVSLNRSLERLRVQRAALARLDGADAQPQQLRGVEREIAQLEQQALNTTVALNNYARYRAVAQRHIDENGLKDVLGAGEVYAKLAVLDDDVFVYVAGTGFATGYRAAITGRSMAAKVQSIRDSISKFEDGQYLTSPFDVEDSRALYVALFGPVADRLAGASHVIFEPDGAMLQLPPNLLIEDDGSLATYLTAMEEPDADPFDVTMIDWMGKNRMVSTAVSARAFADARSLPSSEAARSYLGMGNNATVGETPAGFTGIRGSTSVSAADCEWPLAEWNNPISQAELVTATTLVGGGTDLMVGQQFTDTAIMSRGDLADFRILHFATHGLVTPPGPRCPTRPALLTSFGGGDSDGLLSFAEIFDLKLDADLVILSACDTAGAADVATTRAAGLGSGGGTALDGLVRSFVGAGGRAVLASHWPAPDDFGATTRLMEGLFEGQGQPIGQALLGAQQVLMNDPLTSHPYYWSGFAIVGDAARPLLGMGG